MSTVLIVDDDTAVRILLRTVLERDGYHVVEAPDGRAALDFILHQHVDVILTDVMMPVMSGYDLLAQLAEFQPERRNVIVLTAISPRQLEVANLTCVHTSLRKPFELDELREAVRAVSRKRVLVVEDDVPTQYLVRRALQPFSYEVTMAADGTEALRALQEHSFDALVVDLMLPTISGYDVIDHIASINAAPPVVVLTVLAKPDRPLPHVAAYLRKPDGIERLVPTLRAIA